MKGGWKGRDKEKGQTAVHDGRIERKGMKAGMRGIKRMEERDEGRVGWRRGKNGGGMQRGMTEVWTR